MLMVSSACASPEAAPFLPQDQYVSAVVDSECEPVFACGCPQPQWPDLEACVELQTLRAQDTIVVAERNGLRYDGACGGELLQRRASLSCEDTVATAAFPACPLDCKPFVGDRGLSERCSVLGVTVDVDDCAQGLHCVDRRCVPLCLEVEPLAESQRCRAGIVELGRCDEGLYCDEQEGRCAVAAVRGEACDERPCDARSWCSVGRSKICQPPREVEASCFADEECDGSCLEGRCVPPAARSCTFP